MAEQGLPTRTVERAIAEVFAFLDPHGAPASSVGMCPELVDYLREASVDASRWARVTGGLFGRPRFTPQDIKAWLGRLARGGTVDLDVRDPTDEWSIVVTMPVRTRTALLDGMESERFHRAARVAASLLQNTWLDADMYAHDEWGGPMTEETERFLFANFQALRTTAGDLLVQPETCHLLHWVGYHYRDSTRHTPADHVAYLSDLLRTTEPLLGSQHPSTLRVQSELGEAHGRDGDPEAAVALHERVLVGRQSALGPNHKETFDAMGLLGASRRATGQIDDAVELLARAITGLRDTAGSIGFELDRHRDALVDTYCELGRADDALALRREYLSAVEKRFGATHPMTLGARNELAATLATLKHQGDAAREYRAVLDTMVDDHRATTSADPELVAEAEKGLAELR